MRIKLMQFNIEDGGDVINFDTVINIIKKANPDIVALEEPWGKTQLVAEKLGWKYYNIQNHIVSKYPIIDPLGKGLFVFVQINPEKIVLVCNIHLPSDPYGPDVLRKEGSHKKVKKIEEETRMEIFMKYLSVITKLKKSNIPIFITGDFNTPSHLDYCKSMEKCFIWPVSKKLEQEGFKDGFREVYPDPEKDPGYTWWANRPKVEGTWNPTKKDIHDRIDFIYTYGPVKTVDFKVITEDYIKEDWPSDHRAIIGEFEVTPINIPTLVSIQKRLNIIGDIINIHYYNSRGYTLTIIHDIDIIYKKQKLQKNGSIKVPTKNLSQGQYYILISDGQNIIISKRFWLKDEKQQPILTLDKQLYKSGEPITVLWNYGPGNRFDYVGIVKENKNKNYPKMWASVFSKIEGKHVFNGTCKAKNWPEGDCGKWPLTKGKYEVRFVLDDSHTIIATQKFDIY